MLLSGLLYTWFFLQKFPFFKGVFCKGQTEQHWANHNKAVVSPVLLCLSFAKIYLIEYLLQGQSNIFVLWSSKSVLVFNKWHSTWYFGVSFWESFVALTPKDTEGLILDIWPTKSSPRNVVATFGFNNWQDCTRCKKLWCNFYLFQGPTYASSHMNLETFQRFGLVIFCFFQSFCMCFMSFFQSLCMCDQIELLLVHSDLSGMLTFCTFCKALAIAIPTWKVASPMGQEQGVGEEYIVTYRPYCCSIPWQCKACPASSAMIPFFKGFPKGFSLGWIPFARAVKLHSSHSQRGVKVLVVEQLFGKEARSWWLCIPTFLIK